MRRVNRAEILDSDACSAFEVRDALAVISRINRRFGGVSTSQKLVEEAAQSARLNRLSLLEVAAASGDVPDTVGRNLAERGIALQITLLDMALSHLPRRRPAVVANALHLPFSDGSFDLVSCNLFAHHLSPEQLQLFVSEGLRVCRQAVLINDLVRHPIHLALVYASLPIMRSSRIAWLDGLTSVRRAYTPSEIRSLVNTHPLCASAQMQIFRNRLFRMGITIWKSATDSC